ncbi:type II toxin-antitoxin system Phd/YefM family antitoxin [Agromyces sp. NPDC058484]|uniref:type II toxin-antitoxin system Phd/YefM family antitoxin n=1 Tax=Agromyces sp. NPDC058484 TaxID=3346524 RepID=UPI00364D4908
MATISASEARRSLFPLLAEVNADHSEVRITSKAGNGVLISEDDFEALLTTRHLFSTAANTRHLLESFEQSERGELTERQLADS